MDEYLHEAIRLSSEHDRQWADTNALISLATSADRVATALERIADVVEKGNINADVRIVGEK